MVGKGRPSNRTGYRNESNKRVPSVTTILGKFKDPGPLIYWASKTATDVLEEAHSLLQNHEALGDARASDLRSYLQSNPLERADCRSVSSKACKAGHIAHHLVELWIHADKVGRSNLERKTVRSIAADNKTTMEVARQGHRAFQAFLRWVGLNKFELWQTETPLVSEVHNYGGTLDCIGEVNGRLCLLDWKTSNNLYPEYLLQLAAYGILWDEWYDPAVEEYHLLRFDKETGDFQHFYTADLEDSKEAFLLMRQLYGLMQKIQKRI